MHFFTLSLYRMRAYYECHRTARYEIPAVERKSNTDKTCIIYNNATTK